MHMPKKLKVTLGSTDAFEVKQYLAETPDYAIAVNFKDEVGVTWNRSDERIYGFPHSYKHQQWFILPNPLAGIVLSNAASLIT